MKDIVFIFLISGISFLFAWLIQKSEIDELKEELKLEKAKTEYYINRTEYYKNRGHRWNE